MIMNPLRGTRGPTRPCRHIVHIHGFTDTSTRNGGWLKIELRADFGHASGPRYQTGGVMLEIEGVAALESP